MADEQEKAEGAEVKKLLSIVWPTDLAASYANNLVAQRDAGVLVLSFFQLNPPYVVGDSREEREEQLEKIASINAIPVAKVAVPLSHIAGMMEAIQLQLAQAQKESEPST